MHETGKRLVAVMVHGMRIDKNLVILRHVLGIIRNAYYVTLWLHVLSTRQVALMTQTPGP